MVVRAAFVQALLARRVVPFRDAAALHARLAAACGEPDDLDATLATLHTDLARLGLEVRTCHDQRTGDASLVLVNTKADALAELATPYTAVELAYIKSVVRVHRSPRSPHSCAPPRALRCPPPPRSNSRRPRS